MGRSLVGKRAHSWTVVGGCDAFRTRPHTPTSSKDEVERWGTKRLPNLVGSHRAPRGKRQRGLRGNVRTIAAAGPWENTRWERHTKEAKAFVRAQGGLGPPGKPTPYGATRVLPRRERDYPWVLVGTSPTGTVKGPSGAYPRPPPREEPGYSRSETVLSRVRIS